MRCDICGALEETDSHILLECLLAVEVFRESSVEGQFWSEGAPRAMDNVRLAADKLDTDKLEDYMAIMWEIWNKRNRFIFGGRFAMGKGAATRAISFVRSYGEFNAGSKSVSGTQSSFWKPPDASMLKLNSDAGKMCGRRNMAKSYFKLEHDLGKRRAEAARIREKYPDRIPVIVEKAERSDIPNIDKKKYLVPADLTVGQFVYVIRKRIKLSAEKAIFIFVDNVLPPTGAILSAIYEEKKDEDGFLYVTYSGENTFGVGLALVR
ncbi:hypothetical protein Cgig2_005225 [Carnegiea gigantea]|uniref:Autophagy-related protein n=1 Tax=Carnegiea gigantea TaxID=171969 RepID=A0A9Q1K332_9CARY|nr:hypothetical protein Cgig2_005225 [Carnegiea gigantea]